MEGYKTFTGIFLMIMSMSIGFLLYKGLITSSQIVDMIAGISAVVGAITALYGNIDVHERLKKNLRSKKK